MRNSQCVTHCEAPCLRNHTLCVTTSLFEQTQDLLDFFAKRAEPSVTVYLQIYSETSRFIHQENCKIYSETSRFTDLFKQQVTIQTPEETIPKIPKMYFITNL